MARPFREASQRAQGRDAPIPPREVEEQRQVRSERRILGNVGRRGLGALGSVEGPREDEPRGCAEPDQGPVLVPREDRRGAARVAFEKRRPGLLDLGPGSEEPHRPERAQRDRRRQAPGEQADARRARESRRGHSATSS